MLTATPILLLTSAAWAQTPSRLPDQSDIFRAKDGQPNIELVLDTSGSMADGLAPSICTALPEANRHPNSSGGSLVKVDQLKAVLTGCLNTNDGILDQDWVGRSEIAIRQFGLVTTLVPGADFGATPAQLQTSVLGLPADGSTPMTRAMRSAAFHLQQYFEVPGRTKRCRKNFMIVMTDGEGNELPGTAWDFACPSPHNSPVPAPVPICGTAPCVSPIDPQDGAGYINRVFGQPIDMQCNVEGVQNIVTYTIGFQTKDNPNVQRILSETAEKGGGQFFTAENFEELDRAFRDIIDALRTESATSFSGGSIQNDGLFQGNYMYMSSFKPTERGPWHGTVRKHCIFPLDARGDPDSGNRKCLFNVDGDGWETNPDAVDLWQGGTNQEGDEGGSGQAILDEVFRAAVDDPAPASPYDRNIVTWRPHKPFTDYVKLDLDALTPTETKTPNFCEHAKLINHLHGYTYGVQDCNACNSAADPGCAPQTVQWPTGASIDSPLVLLRYPSSGADPNECESSNSRCYLVSSDDRGMIHFFNAQGDENGATGSGKELSAILPGELFGGAEADELGRTVANDFLADIHDQPSSKASHRFYTDGGIRLVHVDDGGTCPGDCRARVGNGTIDPGEEAYLLVTLGRGGQEMIMIPVPEGSALATTGVPNAATNAPRRLSPENEPPAGLDERAPFNQIRDLWASPWIGQMRATPADPATTVMAFASGHQNYLDRPEEPITQTLSGFPQPPQTVGPLACTTFLEQAGIDPAAAQNICSPPFPDPCLPCTTEAFCGLQYPCYDWPGIDLSTVFRRPERPFRWTNGTKRAVGYRVHFSKFDLGAGDCLLLLNSRNSVAQEICGKFDDPFWSDWIYDEGFSVDFITDGDNSEVHTGFKADLVEYLEVDDGPGASMASLPTVYIMDVGAWASALDVDLGYREALRVRFTSDCGNSVGHTCIDTAKSPDLEFMTCPISAELMGYSEGGVLRALYVGDECGQLWKFGQDLAGDWSARRLFVANEIDASGAVVTGYESKDYRKIFSKVDLVVTRCTGQRSVGVYFGTGNVQRPAADDNLQNNFVTKVKDAEFFFTGHEPDIVGVIFDSPNLALRADVLTLADLQNLNGAAVNNAALTESQLRTGGVAQYGYFFGLEEHESMLRSPTVFKGVAFFKTFLPDTDTPPSECETAGGASHVYAFDNCTGEPPNASDLGPPPSASDRKIWTSDSDIGSGVKIFTPKHGSPFVSAMNLTTAEDAALVKGAAGNAINLLMWRFL